ncbi:hypothetical protein ABZ353_29970 [Streptomyces niveus]|uniref:hypothetical protein n=1 Tax=Streptomyces niveus TaxID=193462 RepID=UPI0033EA14AE
MIWWLKIRAAWVLVGTVLATVGLGLLMGTAKLPLPVLTGGSGSFLIGQLIPVLPAAIFLYGTGRTDGRLESIAAHPMRALDAGWALCIAIFIAGTAGCAYLLARQEIAIVIGRDGLGYIGMALFFAALFGPRAAAGLTTLVPIVLAAIGWQADGRPHPWAWPLLPGTSVLGLLAAMSVLTLGMCFTLVWRAPIQFRR